MTLRYTLFDPTKNVTALVTTPVPPEDRPAAAARIMQKEPSCEQVGFVYRNKRGGYCLDMAGGEFCGNASMCAAALFCIEEGICPDETRAVYLRVSGAPGPVAVQVTAESETAFTCTVTMPPPERISEEALPFQGKTYTLPAVYFPGIAHLILPWDALDKTAAETAVKQWCEALNVKGLGLMLLEKASLTLRPLVYIPAADTLYWEHSCASGTAAVGAYLAQTEGKEIAADVRQPGGTLHVEAAPDGAIRLGGTVEIIRNV
jgi:diaminopimelate epimerase